MLGHADDCSLLDEFAYKRGYSTCVPELRGVKPANWYHVAVQSTTWAALACCTGRDHLLQVVFVEKKPTSQVAQETFHSPEDVEHYVQCFRRIQPCRMRRLTGRGCSGDRPLSRTGPGVPGSDRGIPRSRRCPIVKESRTQPKQKGKQRGG